MAEDAALEAALPALEAAETALEAAEAAPEVVEAGEVAVEEAEVAVEDKVTPCRLSGCIFIRYIYGWTYDSFAKRYGSGNSRVKIAARARRFDTVGRTRDEGITMAEARGICLLAARQVGTGYTSSGTV